MDKLKFYGHQKQKNKLKKLFLMLSILCFAMTGQAFADCRNTPSNVPDHPADESSKWEWENAVSNTEALVLYQSFNKKAYTGPYTDKGFTNKRNNAFYLNKCEYIKGPHTGGYIPKDIQKAIREKLPEKAAAEKINNVLHVTVEVPNYGKCHVFLYKNDDGYYITTCYLFNGVSERGVTVESRKNN